MLYLSEMFQISIQNQVNTSMTLIIIFIGYARNITWIRFKLESKENLN